MKYNNLSRLITVIVVMFTFLSLSTFTMANETPDLSKDLVSYNSNNLTAVKGTPTGLWNKTDIDNKLDVWYYGDTSSMTYNTGSTTKGDLTMTFDVTGLTSASLELDTKYKTEGGTYYDTCQIMIGNDVLWQRNDAESKNTTGVWGWESVSLSLDSYLGNNTIEIVFKFNSKDSVGNSYFGWAVDNVKVTSSGSGSLFPPTSTSGLIINQIDMGNFPSVDIYLSVNDANGDFVSTLTASNFKLKETGSVVDPFTVSLLQSQTAALSLGLVVDESGSMSGSMDDAKIAVKDFLGLSTGAQDQFSIVSIGSNSASAINGVAVIQDFTTDIPALKNAVDSLKATGMTPLFDGILKSLQLTALQPGIKAVIAFTDGSENTSFASKSTVISYAQTAGIPVYTIGIGYVNDTELINIANQTGGFYTKANSISELNTIYQSIQGTILKQYQMSFTSNLTSGDNACYDIEATLPDGSVVSSFQCEVVPGPPQISLDSDTKDMTQTAPPWNEDLTIGAIITDPDGDEIKAVNLYYRTRQSSDSFTKLAMTALSTTDPSHFTVIVPGTDYDNPGIEFYFTASDGVITRTEPAKSYFEIGGITPPPVEKIYLLNPKNNAVMSYGSTTGKINFLFTKVSSVSKYMLHIELNDLLNGYTIPVALDLIPPSSASGTTDPWGTGSGTSTTATPGFTESFLGMTLSLTLDTTIWDTLSKYDLTWGIEAYDSNDNLIASTFDTDDTAAKYINKLKLIASNAIALTSPTPGMVLDKQDSPPVFKWELYQGVSTYTLILAHTSGLGFDAVIDKPGLILNLFTMDDSTWASMPKDQWYWTVLGFDASGGLTPSDFTIFDFEIK